LDFVKVDSDKSDGKMSDDGGSSVKVAVRIRPQLPREIIDACKVSFCSNELCSNCSCFEMCVIITFDVIFF
jgi:hypothetical protein